MVEALKETDVLGLTAGVLVLAPRRMASVETAPGRGRRLGGGDLTLELFIVNDAARVESYRESGGLLAVTRNALVVANGVSALYAGADGFDRSLAVVVVGQETFEEDPWTVVWKQYGPY